MCAFGVWRRGAGVVHLALNDSREAAGAVFVLFAMKCTRTNERIVYEGACIRSVLLLQVLAAGAKGMGHVGECTLHARECGAGVGVFFLVQRRVESPWFGFRHERTVDTHNKQLSCT